MRRALVVANDTYENEGLGRLRAPAADAAALAEVLGDPAIGGFDVRVVRNEPAHVVHAEIEDLFAEGGPDDVLMLHFSCHGLKSESGELFFAARNTRPDRLGSTAIAADFVQRCLRTTRSRSVVLLLDCCYGGAFSQGVTVRSAGDVNVLDSFPGGDGGGRGRAVITASSAIEYAFEGGHLAEEHVRPSVFTSALVDGLATGEADRDGDGWVSLNELYDHVFDRVRRENPNQTPSRDVEMQGELYVARRARPVTTPSPLPARLTEAVENPLAGVRAGAVHELAKLLHGRHLGLALAARLALEDLADDDSRSVATAAATVLGRSPSGAGPGARVLPSADPDGTPGAGTRAVPAPRPDPAPTAEADRRPAGASIDMPDTVGGDSQGPDTDGTDTAATDSAVAAVSKAEDRSGVTSARPHAATFMDAGPGGGAPDEDTPSAAGPPAPPWRRIPADVFRRVPPRWAAVAAGAVVLIVAAAVFGALRDDGGSDAGSGTGGTGGTTDGFTSAEPWRLVVRDEISENDTGCTVTLTETVTRQRRTFEELYGEHSYQIPAGAYEWTANRLECVVVPRLGSGEAELPFVTDVTGDTDAFGVTGPVKVEVADDQGNGSCEIALHDVNDGSVVDIGTIPEGGAPITLDPAGRTQVYVSHPVCILRISAA